MTTRPRARWRAAVGRIPTSSSGCSRSLRRRRRVRATLAVVVHPNGCVVAFATGTVVARAAARRRAGGRRRGDRGCGVAAGDGSVGVLGLADRRADQRGAGPISTGSGGGVRGDGRRHESRRGRASGHRRGGARDPGRGRHGRRRRRRRLSRFVRGGDGDDRSAGRRACAVVGRQLGAAARLLRDRAVGKRRDAAAAGALGEEIVHYAIGPASCAVPGLPGGSRHSGAPAAPCRGRGSSSPRCGWRDPACRCRRRMQPVW